MYGDYHIQHVKNSVRLTADTGKCVPDITRATKILKYHQQPLKYNKNKASYKSVACGRMLKLGRIMYPKGKTKIRGFEILFCCLKELLES